MVTISAALSPLPYAVVRPLLAAPVLAYRLRRGAPAPVGAAAPSAP